MISFQERSAHALWRRGSGRSVVSTDGVRQGVLALVLALACVQSGCGDSNDDQQSEAARGGTPAPVARLRVRTDLVRSARLEGAARVTGTVRAFHRAIVTAETQGRVQARGVEPGAEVEAGGLLVELESSRLALELRHAEAALQAARTVLRHAKRERERAEQLMARDAISDQRKDEMLNAYDRARDELALAEVARDTAERNLADTRITAPFTGTVDSLAVNVGDFVSPGTPVATLVDLSRVRIFGGVTAREAARLAPGARARVSFADLGGAVFDATLMSVGRVASRADGTYEIELWLEDPEDRLRDGMMARIELPDVSDVPILLTHRAALLRRDGHSEVFVVEQEGGVAVARSRRLRTGRSQGSRVEVLDGLDEGDLVVYDGHFALEDGTVVTVEGTAPTAPRAVLKAPVAESDGIPAASPGEPPATTPVASSPALMPTGSSE